MKLKFIVAATACLMMLSQALVADQIEKEAQELAPQGVLVKVNPVTKTVEVFAAPKLADSIRANSATADEMVSAIRSTETSLNKVGEFQLATSELEKESSTEAWRYRWRGGWNWNNWCGYSPYYYNWYQPYSYYPGYFNYGNYNYNYGYNYGYNNCYYGWYY